MMDYDEAASYWEKHDAAAKKADRGTVLTAAEKFILAHNTCALATGAGSGVRCTPLEYTYRAGRFWIFSEGGLKFRFLKQNKNVCLAICDSYSGFGGLGGLQVQGTAELVEPWSAEYFDLLRAKKLPEEALRRLDHPMYLIRITPVSADLLSSDFKKLGFDPRQHLTW